MRVYSQPLSRPSDFASHYINQLEAHRIADSVMSSFPESTVASTQAVEALQVERRGLSCHGATNRRSDSKQP